VAAVAVSALQWRKTLTTTTTRTRLKDRTAAPLASIREKYRRRYGWTQVVVLPFAV
jgi:hypothetical protein